MEKKIVIAGGTGFIGEYLHKRFIESGYQVAIVSRDKKHINWNDEQAIIAALEGAAMLINLAGKSVDCRYNERNKTGILQSRLQTTKALGQAVLKCKNPPGLWINSSTATIYRHAEDRPMTEANGEIGSGFSVNVATSWEAAFFSFQPPATRQIALRMAIVLGKSGGALKPLLHLVRFGIGGKQGKGNQMFSWIHIEDVFRIILFLQSHKELHGVFNCSSPNPVNNQTLMQTLRQVMKMKGGIPMPEWLLKIGAIIIQTETELILKSRWVIPERLLNTGYVFKYPDLRNALQNILNEEYKSPN
ncbi:TIGR01777 family protein [Ilyomonas limi]|uniref:TIGR01777 family protein n=1 Tax=Ilyomonas limi TaxID=2575867 RepID=A0A4V5UTL5_9BACT|nr:TIGR01777 family oxidoreductase [Ilyomonas limi]TKK65573.1 TIGR01777 family protein [Ilyomonas limi]